MVPAEPTAYVKILQALRDFPTWLLAGAACAFGLVLYLPSISDHLTEDTQTWFKIGLVFCGVLTFTKAADGILRWLHDRLARLQTSKAFHIARTLSEHWSTHRQADRSMTTQISAHVLIKNMTAAPLGLIGVKLVKPRIRGEVVAAHITVREQRGNMHGGGEDIRHQIPPHGHSTASVLIIIRGVPGTRQDRDMPATLDLIDLEGRKQRVKVVCKGMTPPNAVDAPKLADPLHAIADPIEKDVAAVLQDEITRYEKNGRQRGGLGSFYYVHEGNQVQIPSDSWTLHSHKNQEIAVGDDLPQIGSDNLDALMVVYQRLVDNDEQQRFVAALTSRLQEDRGYTAVAYLIVIALWRVGLLAEALEAATFGLPEDDMVHFGMSNVVILLNAMLRFQHPLFMNDELDVMERFVDEAPEHRARIPQKIAAIRAHRAMTTST